MKTWSGFPGLDHPETKTCGPNKTFLIALVKTTTEPPTQETGQSPEPWADPESEWMLQRIDPTGAELQRLRAELDSALLALEDYQRGPGVRP